MRLMEYVVTQVGVSCVSQNIFFCPEQGNMAQPREN